MFDIATLDMQVRLSNPYPKKIIIGEKAFEELKDAFHKTMTMGLMVNLKGEYTKLWGMAIEIDKENVDRVELVS